MITAELRPWLAATLALAIFLASGALSAVVGVLVAQVIADGTTDLPTAWVAAIASTVSAAVLWGGGIVVAIWADERIGGRSFRE